MADESLYDVAVIGGGPAGYVAAIKAAQLGGKVCLIEKDVVGGTCLNRGCIPTKTYLKNADIIENIHIAAQRGIILDNTSFKVDMNKTVEVKNSVVKTLTTGVAYLLKSNNVTLYKGTGRITKDKHIEVNGSIIQAKKIILAGGSKVAKIRIPGIESSLVLTSEEILNLREVPQHLAVIGGGVIGVEIGTAFRAFGSEVTIIEMADRILPGMDKEISKEVLKNILKKGIKVIISAKLEGIEQKDGMLILTVNGSEKINADKALLSIGRVPDMDGIGDIEFIMDRGRIKVDDKMQTSVEGIYAPGDINGIKMLAHAAFKMGEIAAQNAMGGDAKVDLKNVPGCVYTIPEAASVGLTEEEAALKYEITVGRFPFSANGRALASNEGTGFVKIVADKKYGEILGVHIVGPCAAEMINEAASLMEMEITVHEVSNIIHGHPTFSEAFMEAASDCLGKCIHLPKK